MRNVRRILLSLGVAGIASFCDGQARAEDNATKPNTALVRQLSLDELVRNTSGWTTSNSALIIGWSQGVDAAKELQVRGAKDAFGNPFNYVFSSNYSGNKFTNSLHAVLTNTGIPVLNPLSMQDMGKMHLNSIEVYSQGCDQFINLANNGLIQAERVSFIAPPGASGFAWNSKLESALMKCGVKEVQIFQNFGDKGNVLDNDHVTTIPFPALQLLNSGTSAVSGGIKIPFDNLFSKNQQFGNGMKVDWHRIYTSPGTDRTFSQGGQTFHESYNLPQMGHGRTENYYPNIVELAGRGNLPQPSIPELKFSNSQPSLNSIPKNNLPSISDLGKMNLPRLSNPLTNPPRTSYTPATTYSPPLMQPGYNFPRAPQTPIYSMPSGYTGPTGRINSGGQTYTVPVAPPNYFKIPPSQPIINPPKIQNYNRGNR